MHRFFLTALIAMALLGGVALTQRAVTRQVDFTLVRPDDPAHDEANAEEARQRVLRITPAFDARKDPFALTLGDEEDTVRILVRSGGRELLAVRDDITRGTVLQSDPLEIAGETAPIYIEATPSPDEARGPCALRVELLTAEHGLLCDDVTLWSQGNGSRIQGEVRFSLSPRLLKLDRGL